MRKFAGAASAIISYLLPSVVYGSPIYRNHAYIVPKLGMTNSSWIFSGWGHEDPAFRPLYARSVSLPLYGSVHKTAYWFADLRVGTPYPQIQSLIADTGSSVMGFPCSDCESCGRHVDPAFDTRKSVSLRPLACAGVCPLCTLPRSEDDQCAYHIRYTEGSSLIGKWYTDKIWLDRDPFGRNANQNDGALFELPFGCHSEETHLFVSQDASGILGLEGTSRFGPPPFVTAVLADLLGMSRSRGGGPGGARDLHISGQPRTRETKPVVSLCMSSSGGVLTIGDVNSAYHVRVPSPEHLLSFFEVVRNNMLDNGGTLRKPSPPKPPATPSSPSSLRTAASPSWSVDGYMGGYYASNRQLCESDDRKPTFPRLLGEIQTTETVLRSTVTHYSPLPAGLVWTPLSLDFDEEGGWPGSYVAVIQEAYVRGSVGSTTLSVPFAPVPLAVRSGTVSGLPALVDSGTTLTYLPFMMYANLWTALLRNVIAANDNNGASRRLGKQTQILRVSGTPFETMNAQIMDHAEKLRLTEIKLMKEAQQTSSSAARQMSKYADYGGTAEAMLAGVQKELVAVEAIRGELLSLMEKQKQDEQEPAALDPGLWQDLAELVDDQSATPRALPERGRRTRDPLGAVLLPDTPMVTVPRRRLTPVSLPNLDEECWYFANIEQDVKHFPDIKIVFANNAEYIWRPSSFLYRKGKTRVFCLTIIADKDGGDESRRLRTFRQQGPFRELGDTKQAVLGSSFFIDHDLVFHLGNWGLGFAEARCPVTDLRRRLGQ